MQKGISLVALVISIIVLIIIAGAVVFNGGLSSVNKVNEGVLRSDLANVQIALETKVNEYMLQNFVTRVTPQELVNLNILQLVSDDRYMVKVENLDLSKTTGTFYCNSKFLVYEAKRDELTVTVPQ